MEDIYNLPYLFCPYLIFEKYYIKKKNDFLKFDLL